MIPVHNIWAQTSGADSRTRQSAHRWR